MTPRFLLKASLLILLGLAVVPANAQDGNALVYEVQGKANTLFLVGSIHMLRAEDFPPPETLETAYQNADALIMELDLDDIDPVEQSAMIRTLAMAPPGSSLRQLMGEEAWETANEIADREDINLRLMDEVRPWFAAITAVQLKLMQLGYRQDYGIEGYFLSRAGEDGKPISGLETLQQQIGLFASQDNDKQVEFLLMSLAEIGSLDTELDVMIDAWQSGDGESLYALLETSFEGYPGLFDVLVRDRNRNWIAPLTLALDQEQQNYMVIVGALHLLGPSGIVELLRQKGYVVTRL